ncbi:MAG: hypothetical protein QNJ13_09020 [Paracoccaceae bacterium]|nr:hypothetical protein [Paracoccaceae bacterium]
MSDVLDIARARREALKTEITHLDAFIRMGEKLARGGQPVNIPAAIASDEAKAADPAKA